MSHEKTPKPTSQTDTLSGVKDEFQVESAPLSLSALMHHIHRTPGGLRPDLLTSTNLMQLQRSIGNQGIQRFLGLGKSSKGKSSANTAPPPANLPILPNVPAEDLHVIPPANEFETMLLSHAHAPLKIGAAYNRPSSKMTMPTLPSAPAAPSSTAAPETDAGGKQDEPPSTPLTLAEKRTAMLAPIMDRYREYKAARSLANLIKLYDFIKHWLATRWDNTDLRAVGLRVPAIRESLETLLTTIEHKVLSETGKKGIDAEEAAAFDRDKKPGKTITFFEDVGAPQAFYAKLSKRKIKLFESLYNALAANKPAAVPALIAQIGELKIPGWPLVKGLFLTRFRGAAGIDHFQDTGYEADASVKQAAYYANGGQGLSPEQIAAEEYIGQNASLKGRMESNLGGLKHGKGLTPAEVEALTSYTGATYTLVNPNLRGNDLSAPDLATPKGKSTQRIKATIDVLASALNKLPVHQGMAYRMQDSFSDFDAAVKAGSLYTDLAFMSASKTLQGAEYGGGSGGGASAGALQVYMLIQTKNARDVTILSGIPVETEVMFQPGTRFYVKAVWQHVNGRVPKNAPMEAQMILHRQGESKTVRKQDRVGIYHGKVRVVQLVEI